MQKWQEFQTKKSLKMNILCMDDTIANMQLLLKQLPIKLREKVKENE